MRYILLSLAAGLWFTLVLLWPGDTNQTGGDHSKDAAGGEGLFQSSLTSANFGLLGVDFYETANGRKHWYIRSEFAELHRKESYAFLKQVSADFFAEKTGNIVQTTSDYGRSWLDQRLVHLDGNVKVRSRQGYLFSMAKLDYSGANHEFHSNEFVTMVGPDVQAPTMILKGTGLTADIDREHFRLRKRVNGRKRLEKSQWLDINSRSGEFFTEDGLAIFTGNVRSVMPKVDITSDEFRLSSRDGKETLAAKGNVVLKNRDRVGKAEQAFIALGEDQIILSGQARVDSRGNEILGQVIRIYTDDDRIEVERAQGRIVN